MSRTRSASSRTLPRPIPVVSIGSCTVRVTSPGHTINRPFFITERLPAMLIGTIGMPESSAKTNEPPLNRATSPSTLRVPSGKTISEWRSPASFAIFLTIPAPGFCRSTSKCPARWRCQPRNGIRPSDSFATMRSCEGSDVNTIGMS